MHRWRSFWRPSISLLRRFTEGDIDNLVELDGDPEVMRFITGGRPYSTRNEIENEVLPAFLDCHQRFRGVRVLGCGGEVNRAVRWVGSISDRRKRRRSARSSWATGCAETAWGKGYATEGSRALIRVGFEKLGAERVVASTMVVNVASRRVLEKAGLKFVRGFHQPWPSIEGEEKGDVEYAIQRSDWE